MLEFATPELLAAQAAKAFGVRASGSPITPLPPWPQTGAVRSGTATVLALCKQLSAFRVRGGPGAGEPGRLAEELAERKLSMAYDEHNSAWLWQADGRPLFLVFAWDPDPFGTSPRVPGFKVPRALSNVAVKPLSCARVASSVRILRRRWTETYSSSSPSAAGTMRWRGWPSSAVGYKRFTSSRFASLTLLLGGP